MAGRPRRVSIGESDMRVSAERPVKTTQGVTMEYGELGRTGLRVSVVGYGTAPLGDMFGANDEDAALQSAYRALDAGINFFDSSPFYGVGLAERRLGKVLSGRRHEIIVGTKAGRYGYLCGGSPGCRGMPASRRRREFSGQPVLHPALGLRHDLDRDCQAAAPRLRGSGRRGTDRRGPARRCAGRHRTRPRPSLDDWPPSEQLMPTDSGLVAGAEAHPDGSIEDPEREDRGSTEHSAQWQRQH